ncbi:MAG: tetratricopeptide repeat protein, partial [Geobacter sp.]|nr:tetratricopeptide repeat protein [Geobacter sp.]
MAFRSSIRTIATRYLLGLVVLCLLLAVPPSFALDSQDSQIFIAGFNAYQKKDYQTSIEKMSQVLQKYPDTQLRDMALFWLARANFKAGNRQDAARYMAQFFREYPESPLKGTVEDELAGLATAYAKDEKSRVAGDKAESERLAKEKAQAEEERLASEKAEAEKVAAAKAEEESRRVAAAEKAARKKAESERLAAEKAAAKKAEADRLAKEKAEAERLAKEKAAEEQDRLAAKKAAAEQAAREKAEQEQLAAEKAAAKKAETERLAREKAETERLSKQKVLEERIRLAAEKAAAEKDARDKAERERLALEQAAKDKAEAERLAREKAAAERLAQAKASAEQNRLAMEKADAEKAAAEKAAAEKSAQERRAARKAEDDRHARQQAEAEQKRLAEKKAAAEQKRIAEDKRAAAKAASGKRKGVQRAETARDKTIAEYKAIIDRAPASSAAEAASAKLKALGVDYPAGHVKAAAHTKEPPATAQVLTLEVGQFADVEFTVATAGQAFPVGRRLMVPFEVLNRGNGADSFYLESGFPAEYGVQFVAEGKPDVPVNLTPQLAPGERFRGVMALTIPRGTIDGQKISYPVKLASQYARDVSQSRQVTLIASAPLLRAVINTEKKEEVPGEKVTYRVALLNIGSAPAS